MQFFHTIHQTLTIYTKLLRKLVPRSILIVGLLKARMICIVDFGIILYSLDELSRIEDAISGDFDDFLAVRLHVDVMLGCRILLFRRSNARYFHAQ